MGKYNKISEKDKRKDMNNNHKKLEVNDTYKKDERITTNFEPTDDSDIINMVL